MQNARISISLTVDLGLDQNADQQVFARQPGQDILITGSATLLKSLMEADLVDEYRCLIHPIIIGTGKCFLKDGTQTPGLKLVSTKSFDLGVMLLCYRPDRD